MGNGCLDLVKFVNEQGRPGTWAAAAKTFEDRVVNGQWGASGTVRGPNVDASKVKVPIAPIPGERGFPALCGTKVATPSPTPNPKGSHSPGPSGSFSFCIHKGKPTPCPSLPAVAAEAPAGGSGGVPVALFAIPAVAGSVPYLRRSVLRRRR